MSPPLIRNKGKKHPNKGCAPKPYISLFLVFFFLWSLQVRMSTEFAKRFSGAQIIKVKSTFTATGMAEIKNA